MRILVATDIAARGIDVPNISHVVNYDLPNEPESHVYRVGRTARAGAGGAALAFCDQNERSYLQAIERLMGSPVSVGEHPLAFSLPPALGPQRKRITPPKKRSFARRRPSGVQRTVLAPSNGKRSEIALEGSAVDGTTRN